MAQTLPTDPYQILDSGWESRAYAEAVGAGDWNGADRICLDRLASISSRAYSEMLRMECLAREFSAALAQVSRSTTIYSWMELGELHSYLGGTFESRDEAGGRRRGCKLFSLGFNEYAGVRPARFTVPVDDAIRGALRPAPYTAVPWSVLSTAERIDSRKHLVYAGETECRLPDGTRVPGGASISVDRRALEASPDPGKYFALLESLAGLANVRII